MHEILTKFNSDLQQVEMNIGDYVITPELGIKRIDGTEIQQTAFYFGRIAPLFDKLKQFRRAFSNPILIIDDFSKAFRPGHTGFNQIIYDSILYIINILKISIIITQSIEQSALLIRNLAEKVKTYKYKPDFFLNGPSPNWSTEITEEDQLFFMHGLENISINRSIRLLNKFKAPWNAIYAWINKPEEIMNVEQIGKVIFEKNKELLINKYHY